MSDSSAAPGGFEIGRLLGTLFIGLKLTGFIDWSWWWVLSPFWIPAGLALLIFLGAITRAVLGEWWTHR